MNDPDDYRPVPVSVLASLLGLHRKQAYRYIYSLGIELETSSYEGRVAACCPVGTLTIVRNLAEQRRAEQALPDLMSIGEIADALGKSYGWTANAIKRHSFKAVKYEQRRAFRTALYKKRAYKVLQNELSRHPSEEVGYNLAQLVLLTGFDRDWIVNRMKESSWAPQLRQSPLTGKVLVFYPPETVKYLQSLTTHPAAGSWLTAEAIIAATRKSVNWTMSRLRQPHIAALAEMRLDAQKVPRLHYPPSVLAQLEQEAKALEAFPKAGDWLLPHQIARKLGRSKLWVNNRLQLLEVTTEQRRDGKGRVKEHYPPGTIERLQSEIPDDLRRN